MFEKCCIQMEDCVAVRRCFMTGEFCSKQMHIQHERNRLHSQNELNAFVIMNFSNMSDVVYKWKIRSFVESLTKYLYFLKDKDSVKRLYCFSRVDHHHQEKIEDSVKLTQVKKINVVRSDSNPTSNFVMCSRVCQQLQIADLVIVDVSVENTNVFYELGMAAAMGKLILPICYSESFYERTLSRKLVKLMEENKKEYDIVEHHMGCYPWRKSRINISPILKMIVILHWYLYSQVSEKIF